MEASLTSSPSLLTILRSPRIGPYSAFDTIGSIAVAYGIASYYKLDFAALIGLIPITSVIGHRMTGQDTPFTRYFKDDYKIQALVGLITMISIYILQK
jgi:hypothetical protein